ncbi:MAG: hypothetical protein C5B58_00345 [Acidobacteria bacterium]|nr:MAG: hypothetical protein C5B58_00345 [Acidobacteriota bacterium]
MKLIALWRHWDGSIVEFYDTGWRSTDPEKSEWLTKMNWLCSTAPAIPPVIKMWLEDNCELIGFFDSQVGPVRRDGKSEKLEAGGVVDGYIEHGNALKRYLQLPKRKLRNGIRIIVIAWKKMVGSRRSS